MSSTQFGVVRGQGKRRIAAVSTFLRALRFLLHVQLPRPRSPKVETRKLKSDVTADVYRAVGTPRGTVIVVHGMSPLGIADPRLHGLCHSLAAAGYQAVAPQLPAIAALKIRGQEIGIVSRLIRELYKNSDLCPGNRPALFAPSFSGAIIMAAAARPETAHMVSAILTVGAPGEIDNTLRFLLARQDIDDYGRLVCLRNFIHLSLGPNRNLRRALDAALVDNWYKKETLPAVLAAIPARDRKLYQRLYSDPEFRLSHVKRILPKIQHLVHVMNIMNHVPDIKAPVTLVHGIDDNVIPPEESMHVFERLQKYGVPSRLVVTPLITHGDTQISPALMKPVFEFASAVAFFFDCVEGKIRVQERG